MLASKVAAQQKRQYATKLRLPQRSEHFQKRYPNAKRDHTSDMPKNP